MSARSGSTSTSVTRTLTALPRVRPRIVAGEASGVPRSLRRSQDASGWAALASVLHVGKRRSGLIPWVVLGVVLVPAYDLEWGGRIVHNDIGFALGWGAFPVFVGAAAQGGLNLAVALAAGFAVLTSLAQRRLSTSVRALRRRAATVEGEIAWQDGTRTRLDSAAITRPAEATLLLLAGAHTLLAIALVVGAI
jgi:hypothetical protein